MTTRVKLPDNTDYPITLSTIGGDPDRSRTLAKGKTNVHEAADRDELQALIAVGGVVEPDASTPEGPATPA